MNIKKFIFILLIFIILVFTFSCSQNKDVGVIYPDILFDEHCQTDFGDTNVNEQKTLNLRIYTKDENYISSNNHPWCEASNITKIIISDSINFYLDLSMLDKRLLFGDDTSFNVIFYPKSPGEHNLVITIFYDSSIKNDYLTINLKGNGI